MDVGGAGKSLVMIMTRDPQTEFESSCARAFRRLFLHGSKSWVRSLQGCYLKNISSSNNVECLLMPSPVLFLIANIQLTELSLK